MRNRWKALGSVAVALALIAAPLTAANATYWEPDPEPDPQCTPSDAWTETVTDAPAVDAVPEILEVSHTAYQRYSWTGGPIEGAPDSTPPGDDWQANTENYENGHSDDPVGVAFDVSHGSSGNADWFYWTATKVIDQPYVPGKDAVPAQTHTVEHAAVTCPGDDEPEIVSEWVTWETPQWFPALNGHVGAPNNAFPQSFVGLGQIAPTDCETTYQQDLYVGTQEEIDAVLADDTLTGPPNPYEDGSIVEDWTFVSTDACPPPPPGDDVIPVPALFAAQPSLPDCDTDGALPTFDGSLFPNVTFQITPEFTGPGEYVLTVTPNEGYAFDPDNLPAGWGYEPDGGAVSRVLTVDGATGIFQSTDPEADCYLAPTPQVFVAAPAAPTFFDTCGTANDGYDVPNGTDEFEYVVTEDGDTVSVEAVLLNEANEWAEGAVTEWSFTFTDVACPTTPPAKTPPTTASLAATGGSDMTVWGVGAAAAMLAGLSLLGFRRFARR